MNVSQSAIMSNVERSSVQHLKDFQSALWIILKGNYIIVAFLVRSEESSSSTACTMNKYHPLNPTNLPQHSPKLGCP